MANAPMFNQMVEKQRKRRILMNALYDLLPVGEEAPDINTATFVGNGINAQAAKQYVKELCDAGIVSRRMEYGSPKNGFTPGRHFHWTLMMSREEAIKRLDDLDVQNISDANRNFLAANKKVGEARRIKNESARLPEHLAQKLEQVAVRTAKTVEGVVPVEAIAGPERPSPFADLAPLRKDESYALVEAARQYQKRTSTIDQRIDDLLTQARDLGLTVDEIALRESITFETDDRLEHVALVLPYVVRLEREIDVLQRQLNDARDRLRKLGDAERQIATLRDQNQRLIAKMAQAN